jgi:hypothetical protein
MKINTGVSGDKRNWNPELETGDWEKGTGNQYSQRTTEKKENHRAGFLCGSQKPLWPSVTENQKPKTDNYIS